MRSIIWDWLVGLLTEPPSSILTLAFLYLGGLVAFIHAFYRGWKAMFNRLWPPRPGKREWFAQSIPTPPNSDVFNQPDSAPDNAWRKDRGRWTNGKNMEVGDWFYLYLDKPRTLS